MRLCTGVFYTDNKFKQVPLIQVTSGGQRSLLKKKLQVCESQKSCLFVGDQILIFFFSFYLSYFFFVNKFIKNVLDFFVSFCLS